MSHPTGTRIGIIGGGQLGRMLALAGAPLGLQFVFLDPSPEACARALGEQIVADYDELMALERLLQSTDVITLEFENIPISAARFIEERGRLFPGSRALEVAQDRVGEKSMFSRLGIPTPPWRAVNSQHNLQEAIAEIGLPAVLKTCRLGYDGKGQSVLKTAADVERAWSMLGGRELILEGFIDFQREVSLIAVRSRSGDLAFYPLTENTHEQGILKLSLSRANDPMQAEAESLAHKVLDELDYVGTMGFEFFVTGQGLIANEIAPRVHNTGHGSIEGNATSQFENHLRAILDLPLGSTAERGASAMFNFVGSLPPVERALAIPDLHFHDYGKSPRPGRKVGHATLIAVDEAALAHRLDSVRTQLGLR